MRPTRLFVVLACYILSGPGISLSFFLFGLGWVVASVVTYAWLAHFALCIIWVWQKPMHWFLAKTGVLAGIICLIIAPVGFLFLFPCVLLALHIIRYYWVQKNLTKSSIYG